MKGTAFFITTDGKKVEKVFTGVCREDVIARAYAYSVNAFRQYKLIKVEF